MSKRKQLSKSKPLSIHVVLTDGKICPICESLTKNQQRRVSKLLRILEQ